MKTGILTMIALRLHGFAKDKSESRDRQSEFRGEKAGARKIWIRFDQASGQIRAMGTNRDTGTAGKISATCREDMAHMTEVEVSQLKRAVEGQHACTATFVQSVPVEETFEG